MPYRVDAITAAMAGPMGVDVEHAGEAHRGFFDTEVVEVPAPDGGTMLRREQVLTVAAGAPEAAVGDIITIDGTDYDVRDVLPQDDGGLVRILVGRR